MTRPLFVAVIAAACLSIPIPASAHCDAVDGPVVTAAAAALQNGDLTLVLRWIAPGQETELREAFAEARAVREGGTRARALADRFFFETAVRLHRQSEGEPYTGLQSAGHISEPLAAADRAIAGANVDRLADSIARQTVDGLRARFAEVMERRAHADENVDAGRRFVAAYVAFMNYVETLAALQTDGPLHK